MVSHVDTTTDAGLLLESSNLHGSIINGEVLEESLRSGSVDVRNSLGSGVDLLLSLSLTTIEGHVDGDLTLIDDTAVNKLLVTLKGSDTELELESLLVGTELLGDLVPINGLLVRLTFVNKSEKRSNDGPQEIEPCVIVAFNRLCEKMNERGMCDVKEHDENGHVEFVRFDRLRGFAEMQDLIDIGLKANTAISPRTSRAGVEPKAFSCFGEPKM